MRIDANVASQLEELHPPRLILDMPSTPPLPQEFINIPSDQILRLLSSIRKHPAPGITNLRYDHIRQCIGSASTPEEHDFLSRLQWFLMLIANARLPADFMRFIGSSVLVALPKPGGGIRPIAMGDVFRRMTSSLLQRHYQASINTLMLPLQLGIGASCGVEKIFHLAQAYLQSQNGDIVIIDFQNAFNSVSRSRALDSFARRLPALYPYLSAIYNQDLWLWFLYHPTPMVPSVVPTPQPDFILSQEGSQQGDPLGPLFFAMAILPLLEDIQRLIRPGLVQAYIDDLTIMAPTDAQLLAMDHLARMGPQFGLVPNFSKFKILVNPSSSLFAIDYQQRFPSLSPNNILVFNRLVPSAYGVQLLGGPLGSPEYCRLFLDSFIDDINSQLLTIFQLDHFQSIWCLFIYVVQSLPTHLFRMCLPYISKHLAVRLRPFQLSIVSRLSQLHPCPDFQIPSNHVLLTSPVVDQLFLPLSAGGFQLKPFFLLSDLAFLSSILSSYHHLNDRFPSWINLPLFQHMQQAYLIWQEHRPVIADQNPFPPADYSFDDWLHRCLQRNLPSVPHLQHHLCSAVLPHQISNFEASLSSALPSHRVRWLSINQPTSGCFLLAWPKPAWYLTNNQFSVTVRLRLGLPSFEHLSTSSITCKYDGQPIDQYGLHLLICKSTSQARRRHDCIAYMFCQLAQSAGITTSTRQSDLTFYTPTGARIADFVLFHPHLDESHGDSSIYCDPTIVNPFSLHADLEKFIRDPSSFYVSHAADKISIYNIPCREAGHVFLPLVINTYGNVASEVNNFLLQLSQRYASHTSTPISVAVQSFRISFITTLIRFNANIIIEGLRHNLLMASSRPSMVDHSPLINTEVDGSVASTVGDRVGIG
jgi:hypothetical protein